MKKIYQLKSILDLVIVFSMMIIGFVIIGLTYGLVTGNMGKMNIAYQGQKIDSLDSFLLSIILIMIIGYAFFMYSIFQLKKLVNLFIKREFFTDLSVKTLKMIGVTMLTSSILLTIPVSLYAAFGAVDFKIMLGSLTPDSMVFPFIISLFFIILSSIFNEAKRIKEDNELTI